MRLPSKRSSTTPVPRLSFRTAGETAESLIERAELGATLSRALLALPFEQRQAVVLVDVYGFQYEEVAQVAGASVGTVKSRDPPRPGKVAEADWAQRGTFGGWRASD